MEIDEITVKVLETVNDCKRMASGGITGMSKGSGAEHV